MRIGPEPTTDNFHVIEYADEDGKIPGTKDVLELGYVSIKLDSLLGNVLSVDSNKPFRHLQQFGGTFLSRFEAEVIIKCASTH